MAALQVTGEGEQEPRFTFAYVVFNNYHDDVRAEVARQSAAFAEDLGGSGIFMEPFESSRQSFADKVRSWSWPDEVTARMDSDGEPIILVVRGRLTTLDPQHEEWALIWLSDFGGEPYKVRPLFQALARKTKMGGDVVQYLRDVAHRRARLGAARRVAAVFARTGHYVEWKPAIPLIGVGLDIKEILLDLSEALDRRD